MFGKFLAGVLVLITATVPNASFDGIGQSGTQSSAALANACAVASSTCVSTFPLMADASTDRFFAVLLGH